MRKSKEVTRLFIQDNTSISDKSDNWVAELKNQQAHMELHQRQKTSDSSNINVNHHSNLSTYLCDKQTKIIERDKGILKRS